MKFCSKRCALIFLWAITACLECTKQQCDSTSLGWLGILLQEKVNTTQSCVLIFRHGSRILIRARGQLLEVLTLSGMGLGKLGNATIPINSLSIWLFPNFSQWLEQIFYACPENDPNISQIHFLSWPWPWPHVRICPVDSSCEVLASRVRGARNIHFYVLFRVISQSQKQICIKMTFKSTFFSHVYVQLKRLHYAVRRGGDGGQRNRRA